MARWLAQGWLRSIVSGRMRGKMNKSDRTAPGDQALRTRLYYGRPLTSRTKWVALKVSCVLGCVAGVAAVLLFADGIVFVIGLTVMAFFVGGLVELFALRYDSYRKEWELANGADSREGKTSSEPPT